MIKIRVLKGYLHELKEIDVELINVCLDKYVL